MARSYPPVPESGEAPEDDESESLVAVESDAKVSKEEDDDEGSGFFLARRDHPADDLHDTAGSSPSNQDEDAEVTVNASAREAPKRAASAFADENSLWSS